MAGARLRKLVLRGCSGVTSTGLTKVATKCRLLAELSVSDCLQITDHDVLLLCQEELDLSQNKAVTDVAIGAICRCCTKLRSLNISGCHLGITDKSCGHLSRSPWLRDLKMTYLGQVTDSGLGTLACHGQLKSIELRGCPQVSDTGVLMLVELCRELELLDVSGCDLVTNEAVTGCLSIVTERPHKLTLVSMCENAAAQQLLDMRLAVSGTSVELERLPLGPSKGLDISRFSRCVEHLRPDRMERFGIHEDVFMEGEDGFDGYEGDGENHVAREFEDFLENDDVLMKEAYELS
ncbi:fbxl13, putative [Ixodes scapularis]|uniref:Fbxl13, putative n=1 Tax=Ixodes scapularis TaxID=6945 RepID=B7P281_IXOSC|nr:fbxl13, putative [Ixodes scapularis]|eukprot:XP_002401798.1 fbxl13, putative [Ixodes scapularis]